MFLAVVTGLIFKNCCVQLVKGNMMNYCAIQQNSVYAAYSEMGREYVVCPKPRRAGICNSAARSSGWRLRLVIFFSVNKWILIFNYSCLIVLDLIFGMFHFEAIKRIFMTLTSEMSYWTSSSSRYDLAYL